MDWDGVIERNREALKRILATLVAMAGPATRGQFTFFPHDGALSQGLALAEKSKLSPAPTLPRHLHRAILALLRPAEAAARRLVIVAARDLVVTLLPRKVKPKPEPFSIFVRHGRGTGIVLPYGVKPRDILPNLAPPRPAPRSLALPLLDILRGFPRPRRPVTTAVPRISVPGVWDRHPIPVRRPPLPDDLVDTTRLALRLQAIGRALDDLPGHARRFARWRARGLAHNKSRDATSAQNGKTSSRFRRVWPLRPSRPPGERRRPTHEVHEVLADLQFFAVSALERRDSS